MGISEPSQNRNAFILAGITVVLCVIIHFIYNAFFSKKSEVQNHEAETVTEAPPEKKPKPDVAEARASGKSKKRAQWKGKTDFSHPWLLKNLKGHPGNVLLMDFSANGKFMAATCDETTSMVERVSFSCGFSPRDHRRSPSPPKAPTPKMIAEELVAALQPHLLSVERMWALGYPLEMKPNSCEAVVYVNPPTRPKINISTNFDVNAPEFIPGASQNDSGRGSWGSTPRSDSDEEADAVEHVCVRCDRKFRVTPQGEYMNDVPCVYHWGRLSMKHIYSCCSKAYGSGGCTSHRFHVWNGTKPGMNGPLEGYVRAKSLRGGIYAIDTEMCYTIAGLELASVAVIGIDGRLVYKALVKPSSPVVDFNTRFSGIRPRDLARATKTLRDVQNDILGFVGRDTILIGHALENDLKALKLLHGAVVDTSAMYPHIRGFPMRRSLRALSEEVLGRTIQKSSSGHSALEDARAAMELVIHKVNNERAQKWSLNPNLQPYDPLISSA